MIRYFNCACKFNQQTLKKRNSYKKKKNLSVVLGKTTYLHCKNVNFTIKIIERHQTNIFLCFAVKIKHFLFFLTIFAMNEKRREQLGGYLLDVSKYVLTAVLITTSFTDMVTRKWLAYVLAAIIVVVALFWGLFYFKK